jgi:multidrug efflux pump subunit AcrB
MLVILVVFVFLRSPRTTFIPRVAVPVPLLGTLGAMYLPGYSFDNLPPMAMTISTSFAVDDAIVMIENITRYLEQGMRPLEAALKGAQEAGPTVFTIGIILPIGMVKKNAIMMIDVALAAERNEGENSYDSIVAACKLRFRPILMTTMAALRTPNSFWWCCSPAGPMLWASTGTGDCLAGLGGRVPL